MKTNYYKIILNYFSMRVFSIFISLNYFPLYQLVLIFSEVSQSRTTFHTMTLVISGASKREGEEKMKEFFSSCTLM